VFHLHVKLAIMMIALLTWHLTDIGYKFLYVMFDKALYRYCLREIHEFMLLCSKFIEVYLCQKLFQCKN